jgi:hypothetical protein
VRAVIESMTGARFVHDTLEEYGWEVLVAVAQKVKGLAPLRARPTRSTRGREAVGCLGADVAFALGDAGASTSSRRSLSQCANRGSATTRSDRRRGLLLGGRSDSARNAATALATRALRHSAKGRRRGNPSHRSKQRGAHCSCSADARAGCEPIARRRTPARRAFT